jgi:RimJ/RimL family protein N-acetyltransferase
MKYSGDSTFTLLESDRLVLRRFKESDLVAFAAYRADPEIARFQSWESYDLEKARAFFVQQRSRNPGTPGAWFQFAVERKSAPGLIGDCALQVRADDPRQVEVGVTFAPEHQGQGYATEALRCLLGYVFGPLAKHRAVAMLDVRNTASARLFERLGFRREGHLIENAFIKGAWTSEYHYALLNREWR